jgi:predicted deacylase
MEYQHIVVPIQNRAEGSVFAVHAYRFNSGVSGPKIYLQANLHGPEVFGTAVLIKLIQEFSSWEKFPGVLTIVPCANPIGVQDTGYNTQLGRWNPQDGMNWNRIFDIPPGVVWHDEKAEREFYEKILHKETLTVEKRLSAELRLLSAGSKYVIDLHTTGVENIEHVFTLTSSSKDFEALSAEYHLVQEGRHQGETFEESHSYPFRKKDGEDRRMACSWELYHHGKMEESDVFDRFAKLLNWLHFAWGFERRLPEKKPIVLSECEHLLSDEGGYYAWTKPIGTLLKKGETYAEIYHPENATVTRAVARRDMYLIGKNGIGATGAGEHIGWVGF